MATTITENVMIKKIVWMSQERAVGSCIDACVSITEPGRVAKFIEDPKHLLRVQFDDHDPQDNSNLLMPGYIWDDQQLMTEEQATDIIMFAASLPEDIDMLVVHCWAGISRSAAVAIALSQILGLDEQYPNYGLYNRYVYRTMMNAYGKMIGVENYV